MNRAQRCFIIGAELTFAVISHLVICRWRFGREHSGFSIGLGRGSRIFAWQSADVWLSSSLGPTAGFIFGIAVPALLVALAVYQYLGWFRGTSPRENGSS